MDNYTIFAEQLEEEVLEQFLSAMKQPYAVKGALMPDAHLGYTLPIGGVVAVKDHILPAWVGYDIGCGVAAVKLDLKKEALDSEKVFREIYEQIPVGFDQYKAPREMLDLPHTAVVDEGLKKHGRYQLGTLGSGNHFIEIGEGKDGHLWIIVHSGSRNLGHFVASHYMQEAFLQNAPADVVAEALKKAKGKEKKIPERILEGHYAFPVQSRAGKDYITDMTYCLAYALENRKRMIRTVAKILGSPKELLFINRNHNHADFKEGLWIHRKGATHAEAGMLGVIPGNMRDGAFIVRGKGNPESLCSSSHGAGRRLSRTQAKKEDMESFEKTMEGVKAKIDRGTLDESPFAYKNIFDVMEAQHDMVEVIDYVRPLINIKGGGRPPFQLKV